MPKWKTDPAAQCHALKKFQDARQRLITTLAAKYPGVLEATRDPALDELGTLTAFFTQNRDPLFQQIRREFQELMEFRRLEKWLDDQISARARLKGITYGSTGKSDDELLASQEDPIYFLPAGLSAEGLLAHQYLLTCKELGIPESEWPSFSIELPDAQLRIDPPPFQSPPYNPVTDSHSTWRARAEKDFNKHCTDFLAAADSQVKLHVGKKLLFAQKQRRGSEEPGPSDRPSDKTDGKRTPPAPIELRLRWAALFRRKGWSYGQLHQKENPDQRYTLDQIKTATQRLLDQLGERRPSA